MTTFRNDPGMMSDEDASPRRDRPAQRLDRGAWLHLILMAALLILAVGSTIYRFTLPTDGWLAVESADFTGSGLIYQTNVMGLPSDLQVGDLLVAVNDFTLASNSLSAGWVLRPEWQAGHTLHYTVVRDGQPLVLDVPLTHWNWGSYWRATTSAVSVSWNLSSLFFLGMAFLTFWRRPDNQAARALWVLAAVEFSVGVANTFLPGMMPEYVFPATSISYNFIILATFTVLLPPALIRFALVFPEPIPALRRRPWLALWPYAVGLLVMVAFVAGYFVFGWLWTAAGVLIALALLVYQAITRRDAVNRAQLRWGLGGAIVGLGLFFLTYIVSFGDLPPSVGDLLNVLSGLGFGIMGLTLAIAILRYRLFDIDVIIRKTTIYALLTALLALIYFGSVVVLQRLLSPFTGESTAAVVLSTLLIAALFLPLRRRVQGVIDRRFFRRKYDAEQVLARFAATARDETDLDALTAELLRVIQETMEPESLSVSLRPTDRRHIQ